MPAVPTTVQGYFGTLVDTLIGFWPPWRRRAKSRKVAVPVLPLLIRAGAGGGRTVARTLEGRLSGLPFWKPGCSECVAAMAFRNLGRQLSYWNALPAARGFVGPRIAPWASR